MKKYLFTTLTFLGLMANSGRSQTIDTLIDVGGYRLHFHIIKGKGMPILFEAGSGADVSMWDIMLKPLADITHATLITYDRAGFGKSELDTMNDDVDKHGILHGIEGLETGLKKLGYGGNIIQVASSFGGFCATLYASRHPATVKAAVLIDANHICWFIDAFVESEMKERKKNSASIKNQNLAYYYQALNLQNTVELMRKTPFPATIPVIDLVSEFNFPDSVSAARWKVCHRQFADAQPNREGITAYRCRHVIFNDNPSLVINAIVKAYTGTLGKEQGNEIMKRFLTYSLEAANDEKRREVQYRHSMDDLTSWGRSLLQQGEKEKATEVFKLSVLLYPESSEMYENLAEAYEAAGNKELAIKNYQRCLQLVPNNKKVEEHLKKLLPFPSIK
ncbi:MAG TPA: alpha/beta fold hydrolase [Niastella sp.]